MSNEPVSPVSKEQPTLLDWAALLAHWTTLAQASLALPPEGDGERWRNSITAIIGLQALACALGELDRLADAAERPLAVDRAEVLLRRHAADLNRAWQGEPMPDGLRELLHDAQVALEGARSAGLEWVFPGRHERSGGGAGAPVRAVLAPHPGSLVEMLLEVGFTGDLYVPAPGVWVFAPAPVAFVREAPASGGGVPEHEAIVELISAFLADAVSDPMPVPVDPTGRQSVRRSQPVRGPVSVPVPAPAAFFRQVYRQLDFARGGPVRDRVVPEHHTLPPGQPLLVPAIIGGEAQPVSLPPRTVQTFQAPLPVEFEESEGNEA